MNLLALLDKWITGGNRYQIPRCSCCGAKCGKEKIDTWQYPSLAFCRSCAYAIWGKDVLDSVRVKDGLTIQ